MNNNTVYVEAGLGPVKDYLSQNGCTVQEVSHGQTLSDNALCFVITGEDNNVMGMEDVVADIPVVSAEGLTPEQVYKRVQRYMQ